jgi:hypothetical protein
LYPWQLNASEPELARGEFTVSVPAAGAGNPIIAGLEETLAQQGAVVSSANLPGMLKPGATPLLAVNVGERSVALAAVQSFGKGKVLGVASNTIWEWARKTEVMRGAYATFWRQAVRNLTGKVEGGRVLSVRWDKEFYRPGDLAVMEIRCAELRLTAAVTMNNETKPLAVEPVKGRAGESAVQWRFKERGEYVFRLVAYQGENVLESYEKTQPVAPLLAEGSRLELDEEGLKKLAEKGGGMFLRESEAGQLAKNLAARLWQKTTLSEMPLAQAGPWFVLIVLGLLASEWWMRRKMNLI